MVFFEKNTESRHLLTQYSTVDKMFIGKLNILIYSIKANPLKNGDAKPRAYSR
jgi:hypothetical protein